MYLGISRIYFSIHINILLIINYVKLNLRIIVLIATEQ